MKVNNIVCSIKYDGDLVPATLKCGKGSMFRSPQYKAFREIIGWLYKAVCAECRNDRLFKIEINMRQNCTGNKRRFYRGDIDNITKPIMDSATGIVWADDGQVVELHVKLDRSAFDSGFDATIYDLGEWHNYRQVIFCTHCGKEFKKLISQAKLSTLHFCSRNCMNAYKRIPRLCLNCGKKFYHLKSAKRGTKFCSNQCYWENMRKNPENYPNLIDNLSKNNPVSKSGNNKGKFIQAILPCDGTPEK